MKKTLLSALLLMSSVGVVAQEATEKKWRFETDLRYQHMLVWNNRIKSDRHYFDEEQQKMVDYHSTESFLAVPPDEEFPNKFGGMSVLLMETYRLSPHWTVGLGAGLSFYNQLDYRTVPVFALGRWNPWKKYRYSYFYAETGLLGLSTLNVGYGGSIKVGKRRRLDLKIGYDLQVMREKFSSDGVDHGEQTWARLRLTNTMHCLQGSIGLVW